ncbi:CapA family protein [Oleiharenicola lentus]|uniref:CapA family protein n=1 Tax=Oleiharenicola lentus TaxID=2508720 RepID=UPI003F66B7C8
MRLLPSAFALLSIVTPLAAQMAGSGDTTMVFTGDAIINRRLSNFVAPNVDQMFATIRKADVAFTNFETLVHDFKIPGAAQSGGTYMGSPAYVTSELEWAGFDIVSLATNHTNDYGIEGLRQTIAALDASKLVHAGGGENLARARSPKYWDARSGRVALISLASTFSEASPAGPQRKDMPGRPGLNPLRHEATYTVDQATLALMQKFAGTRGARKTESGEAYVNFLGGNFKAGATPGTISREMNKTDFEEIMASVRDARGQSDWVIVSIHCHENPGPGQDELPPDFYIKFARAAIDNGADVVVGHGPHFLKGIEVYKNRPILYSLGNFIFENDLVEYQPAENYDKTELTNESLPGDYFWKRTKGETTGFPANQHYWESVIAETVFGEDRTLKQINLHPVVLGFGKNRQNRGRPYPANAEESAKILEDVRRLSAPMGTKVTAENGIGIIKFN